MKAYQNIIVGTDLTSHSANAIRYAACLARRHGATLHIIHLLHHEGAAVDCRREHVGIPEMIRKRWIRLEQLVERLIPDRSNLHLRLEVDFGHHIECLMSAVDEYHADLLILGSRRHDGLSHKSSVKRSLALACIRKAPCDILLVSRDQAPPFKHVVVRMDSSDSSRRCIELALSVAQGDGAGFIIVEARPSLRRLQHQRRKGISMEKVESLRPAMKQEIEASGRRWMIRRTGAQYVTETMESPDEVEGWLSYLTKKQADLFVVSVQEKDSPSGSPLASMAEQVILQTKASVLAVQCEKVARPVRERIHHLARSRKAGSQ